MPIPGCRSAERIEENAGSAKLSLAQAGIKEIRKLSEEADVHGQRYPEAILHTVEGECLPLEQWKGE